MALQLLLRTWQIRTTERVRKGRTAVTLWVGSRPSSLVVLPNPRITSPTCSSNTSTHLQHGPWGMVHVHVADDPEECARTLAGQSK